MKTKTNNKIKPRWVETEMKLTPQLKRALEKWATKLLTSPVVVNFNGRRRVIR